MPDTPFSRDPDSGLRLKPALVSDLDGTLRYPKGDKEHINKPKDIAFYDGVLEALWKLRDKGFLILGVTNQGGVAHGHMTEADWDAQCERMAEIARKRCPRGSPFHRLRACFFMSSGDHEKYGHFSLLRKPRYGALAVLEHEARQNGVIIDWEESLFIGDREEDVACATAARVHFWHAEDFREEARENILGE